MLTVRDKVIGGIGINALMQHIPVPKFFPHEIELGIICLSTVALALYSMYTRRIPGWSVVGCLIPQQILLFVAMGAAVQAAIEGHYADGYVPYGGGWFIGTDQILRILAAPFYTAAIFTRAMRHEHRVYWE